MEKEKYLSLLINNRHSSNEGVRNSRLLAYVLKRRLKYIVAWKSKDTTRSSRIQIIDASRNTSRCLDPEHWLCNVLVYLDSALIYCIFRWCWMISWHCYSLARWRIILICKICSYTSAQQICVVCM